MTFWGMEGASKGAIWGLYEVPAGVGSKQSTYFPSPIGKPRGSGTEPRAFRSPGVRVTSSIPRFGEHKGMEVGMEVKGEWK